MGVISQTVAKLPGAVRSPHPLTSWAAWGKDAKFLAEDHPWDEPQYSISQLMKLDGYVLILGVSFTSLTAIHLAEEMAGRKAFIRWVVDKGMNVKRVRVGGCSDGFDRLIPSVEDLLKRTTVGSCNIMAAPLRPLVERMTDAIRREPEITMCSDRCDRCVAAVAGGPIE